MPRHGEGVECLGDLIGSELGGGEDRPILDTDDE
jgi:hypothetical protein